MSFYITVTNWLAVVFFLFIRLIKVFKIPESYHDGGDFREILSNHCSADAFIIVFLMAFKLNMIHYKIVNCKSALIAVLLWLGQGEINKLSLTKTEKNQIQIDI